MGAQYREALATAGDGAWTTLRAAGLPRRCLLCDGWTRLPLCAPCLGGPARPPPRCAGCGRTDCRGPGAAPPADPPPRCPRAPEGLAALWALADYRSPWDRLIQRLKFHDRPETAAVLAPLMAAALLQRPPLAPHATLLLPVPLSRDRLRERGYNQAWELARRLGRRLQRPARADLLERLLDTPHQVGLDRARRLHNLDGAFWVPPAARPRLAGRDLALVDDVSTTGATAVACARTLLQAGAASVQLWVMARTPAPDEAAA